MNAKIWALIAAMLWGGWSGALELNRLGELKVLERDSGTEVIVGGSQAPAFTVFRLSDPDRLIVDLSSAELSAISGHHPGAGPVTGVVASQFSDAQTKMARILVGLKHPARYDVRADGNRLLVSVFGDEERKAPEGGGKEAANEDSRSKEAPSPAQVQERNVAHPASRITGLRFSRDILKVEADGEIAKVETLEVSDPPRLVLDVYGVKLSARSPHIHSAVVKDIRSGAHPDKVRLVLDLKVATAYRTQLTQHGIKLRLKKSEPSEAAPSSSEQPASASRSEPLDQPVASRLPELKDGEIEIDGQKVAADSSGTEAPEFSQLASNALKSPKVEVRDLSFSEDHVGGRIELRLSSGTTWRVEHADDRTVVLTLDSAKLAKRLERSLDTSALDTPVRMISAFSVKSPSDRVRVVVVAKEAIDERLTETPQGLSWRLESKASKVEEIAESQPAAALAEQTPPPAPPTASAPPPVSATEIPSHHPKYTGKKVSFEFKDIDVHNLLRLIAEVSKKNVVVADDVNGKVTIRLRNVPWDQALELILRSKGLGKEELGNIIRVAPLKTLEEEAKLREERRKSLMRQEDLVVQLLPVNYATANDMQARVKDVLSERGTVSVDTRTNTLIIRDILSNIGRAKTLVQKLDTQTPQVLIESRIVEANTTFAKSVGVQWGGGAQMATGTGNPTGLAFPYNVVARGGSSGTAPGLPDQPNFAVNLPAAVGQGSGGALGFTFGSVGGAVALNLRLTAAESQGTVRTISAPKVTTLDHNTARISQGVSIPFSQVSAAGVNTTFVEARLSLEVTPHITSNGSVLMNIRAENNQPDPSNTGANGQPAIQRKEATTQVLVKDGDTTVLGGIYVRRGSTAIAQVPFFGNLPILGYFFRTSSDNDNRQELLIFITPRILNSQSIAQNP